MGGPIRAGCLGEEVEKTGKGQAGRESGTLRSASTTPCCDAQTRC